MGETFAYFLATGEQTAGAFSLIDEQANHGVSVPLHRHPDDMESFYVLEGELTLYIGDQGMRAPGGSFAHLYRAIMLASRPGGLPPLESIQESQIEQACVHYGVEFVGSLPDRSD